jgi:hypothetical protein
MASFNVRWNRCGEREQDTKTSKAAAPPPPAAVADASTVMVLQMTVSTMMKQKSLPAPSPSKSTCTADDPDDPQCSKEAVAAAAAAEGGEGGQGQGQAKKEPLKRDIVQTVLTTSPVVQVHLTLHNEAVRQEGQGGREGQEAGVEAVQLQPMSREEEVREWISHLGEHERKDKAQNGEDGLLESIFSFVGTTNKVSHSHSLPAILMLLC